MCLPVSFVNILKAPFLQNTSGRLLLRLENLKVGGSSKDRRTYPLDLFAFLYKKKEKSTDYIVVLMAFGLQICF